MWTILYGPDNMGHITKYRTMEEVGNDHFYQKHMLLGCDFTTTSSMTFSDDGIQLFTFHSCRLWKCF